MRFNYHWYTYLLIIHTSERLSAKQWKYMPVCHLIDLHLHSDRNAQHAEMPVRRTWKRICVDILERMLANNNFHLACVQIFCCCTSCLINWNAHICARRFCQPVFERADSRHLMINVMMLLMLMYGRLRVASDVYSSVYVDLWMDRRSWPAWAFFTTHRWCASLAISWNIHIHSSRRRSPVSLMYVQTGVQIESGWYVSV